jgi:hypothetical protein
MKKDSKYLISRKKTNGICNGGRKLKKYSANKCFIVQSDGNVELLFNIDEF